MTKDNQLQNKRNIARAIYDLDQRGYHPTVREVMEATGRTSTSVMYYNLAAGRNVYWEWEDYIGRSLRLLPAGLRLAEGDGDA